MLSLLFILLFTPLLAYRIHLFPAYERSYPVENYKLSEGGPVYLVVGGAGNREGHAGG